ncbi:MAG: Ppx/GppA family phosphatase, partial [Myxococcota bacterium]
FRAVMGSFPQRARGRLVVVDVGGGSTEIIRGEGGQVQSLASHPMGSVRLTERHLAHDPPLEEEVAAARAAADAAFEAVGPAPGATVIGVAGTLTTLASVALALPSYDAERVHGAVLACGEVERQIDLYWAAGIETRRLVPGMDPRRADVILGGAILVGAVLRRLGAAEIVVSDRGVRWGLIYEMIEALQ